MGCSQNVGLLTDSANVLVLPYKHVGCGRRSSNLFDFHENDNLNAVVPNTFELVHPDIPYFVK